MKIGILTLFLMIPMIMSAQSAPNMVIFQNGKGTDKASFQVVYAGKVQDLKESISTTFKKSENELAKIFASGNLTTWKEIQYPTIWPQKLSLEMLQGVSNPKGTTLNFYLSDASGTRLIYAGSPVLRRMHEYLQKAVDKATKTPYADEKGVFGTIYLDKGLTGQSALSGELFVYTTATNKEMTKWLLQKVRFLSDSAVSISFNDSLKVGHLTGINSSVLGFNKSFTIRFVYEAYGMGSFRFSFYAMLPNQEGELNPIRLDDLHYPLRWYFNSQLD